MKNVAARSPYWISGTFAALGGAGLTRWVAPGLDGGARLGCTVAGQLLALAGLAVICLGVSRRVHSRTDSSKI